MRAFGITASIINNTNRLVSSSDETWGSLREGSWFRFRNEGIFYQIGKINELFIIKDFQCEKTNELIIPGDIGINITPSDNLVITFKEYQLGTILEIVNGGFGFKAGQILVPDDGVTRTHSTTGLTFPTKIKVESVDENGKITGISIENRGQYIEVPKERLKFENGAVFTAKWEIIEQRATMERTVRQVDFEGQTSRIYLDATLPEGVFEGKLSVKKWEMFLTENYVGGTKICALYEIGRDFTPNLRLPLLTKANEPAPVFNLTVKILDQKIKELADKIDNILPKF